MTALRLASLFGCAAAVALAQGCGGSDAPSSSDSGAVTAGSRLGWEQPAENAAELATLRFALYVDGTRNELTGAACAPPATGAGFPCSSPFPAMTPGDHTIQLATYVQGGIVIESAKSDPLTITVAGSNSTAGVTIGAPTLSAPASAAAATAASNDLEVAGGVRLGIEVVAAIEDPTALAMAGDGTVFIGDASGAIHVARNGAIAGTARSADDAAADGAAVLDLVLDARFAETHLVYAIGVTPGDLPSFQLTRYREVNGQFGERAVLLDGVPASPTRPAAALTLAGDGRLFVALDDAGASQAARRPGSYNGKILRLDADGTTPDDQPGASPVYASGLISPRGLTWDAATSSLWVADTGTRRAERRQRRGRGLLATAYPLPLASGPAALAVYRSTLIPALRGSLLAAPADEAGYLLRARFGDTDENTVASTERLNLPGSARARLLKVGPDGSIYVGTEHEILRIAPR